MSIPADRQYKITQQDKDIFERDGYWISPKLIDDEQIERLRRAHDRIWSGDYDGDGEPMNYFRLHPNPDALRKFDNGWWINDEIRAVVTDPFIGELAADLLDTNEIRLWHDQVIYKPGVGDKPTRDGNVGWHQDYGYWQSSDNPNMVTVWIALQDTDLTNGGMMTILGSNHWGLVPDSDSFFNQNMDELKNKYSGGREWVEEPCILKAGQASFHHGLTFHGSGANRTNEPRLSVVAHLMPGGTSYSGRIQRHENVRLLGPRPVKGQPFANDYFPVLIQR
ncbi:phytanoyl-CoA dioxygenase family protein [Paenibacillus mendelii]|uniref:Phytanoyl-CoA dioxygenase family protein n=1 Tax=Paenibacillus mendelii TaxID=206163 RepID=A0ABV6J9M4_9BACL|nr:phytanoyl-CoA dioxygenase family protein [Paenibacillus mendelii]MCQ6559581.1 phytanoyl-CoA dioxygenase family protein [Paenibacillus mendelii]